MSDEFVELPVPKEELSQGGSGHCNGGGGGNGGVGIATQAPKRPENDGPSEGLKTRSRFGLYLAIAAAIFIAWQLFH